MVLNHHGWKPSVGFAGPGTEWKGSAQKEDHLAGQRWVKPPIDVAIWCNFMPQKNGNTCFFFYVNEYEWTWVNMIGIGGPDLTTNPVKEG